jgi:hypothetical protein
MSTPPKIVPDFHRNAFRFQTIFFGNGPESWGPLLFAHSGISFRNEKFSKIFATPFRCETKIHAKNPATRRRRLLHPAHAEGEGGGLEKPVSVCARPARGTRTVSGRPRRRPDNFGLRAIVRRWWVEGSGESAGKGTCVWEFIHVAWPGEKWVLGACCTICRLGRAGGHLTRFNSRFASIVRAGRNGRRSGDPARL